MNSLKRMQAEEQLAKVQKNSEISEFEPVMGTKNQTFFCCYKTLCM